MYVILVNPDNTLYGSVKQRVMQRSKLVDTLKFVVDPIYNGIDMTDATVMLEYILPVSREYKTVVLTLSEERYNDCYLQYILPFDLDLTSQVGLLELQLTFAYVEMTPSGMGIQRVRKTSPTTIEITPISAWSDIIPDSALGGLDQRLIAINTQIQALGDYLNVVGNYQVDNLVYDSAEETLQLSSKGVGIGDKVSVRDMLDDGIPVVDFNDNSDDSNEDPDKDDNDCGCGCNCGCEDNVVEFGDTTTTPPNDESDIVEF